MSFTAAVTTRGRTVVIQLEGDLDAATAPVFHGRIDEIDRQEIDQLVLDMTNLAYMSSAGLRGLVFARQKMGQNVEIVLVGVNHTVGETIRLTGFQHSVVFADRVAE
jgi:anti-anti-sigma factor